MPGCETMIPSLGSPCFPLYGPPPFRIPPLKWRWRLVDGILDMLHRWCNHDRRLSVSDSELYGRLWNGDIWGIDVRMWLCSLVGGLPLCWMDKLLAMYISLLYYFSSFSHPLLLILYNSWYAGVYLYWRSFASSINIVGGDSPGNYSKKITC